MTFFFLVTWPGIVKEHTLYRDGPISSVKLFSLTSSQPEAISGKRKLIYFFCNNINHDL